MSDQIQPTPIDLLVNRLANRVGQLTAENEWLAVQLEQASAEIERLRPITNGEATTPNPDATSPSEVLA